MSHCPACLCVPASPLWNRNSASPGFCFHSSVSHWIQNPGHPVRLSLAMPSLEKATRPTNVGATLAATHLMFPAGYLQSNPTHESSCRGAPPLLAVLTCRLCLQWITATLSHWISLSQNPAERRVVVDFSLGLHAAPLCLARQPVTPVLHSKSITNPRQPA